jgi:hypothetical protein
MMVVCPLKEEEMGGLAGRVWLLVDSGFGLVSDDDTSYLELCFRALQRTFYEECVAVCPGFRGRADRRGSRAGVGARANGRG